MEEEKVKSGEEHHKKESVLRHSNSGKEKDYLNQRSIPHLKPKHGRGEEQEDNSNQQDEGFVFN